jgi:exonuclease VII large subunit
VRDTTPILEILRDFSYTMHETIASRLEQVREHIHHLLKSHAFNRPIDLLYSHSQHIDELTRSMSAFASHRFSLASTHLTGSRQRLLALNPVLALKRGYTIIRKGGKIVDTATRLRSDDEVVISFHDGDVSSTIS